MSNQDMFSNNGKTNGNFGYSPDNMNNNPPMGVPPIGQGQPNFGMPMQGYYPPNGQQPYPFYPNNQQNPQPQATIPQSPVNDAQQPKKNDKFDLVEKIVGIALIVLLVPIMIINLYLSISGAVNKDDVPSIFGVSPLIIPDDNNMDPVILNGDLIFVKKDFDKDNLQEGDIISFKLTQRDGSWSVYTHVIVERKEQNGKIKYVTNGVSNLGVDAEAVSSDNIVGVYCKAGEEDSGARIKGFGSVMMWIQEPIGMIVVIGIPIVLLIGIDVLRRWLYNKKHPKTVAQPYGYYPQMAPNGQPMQGYPMAPNGQPMQGYVPTMVPNGQPMQGYPQYNPNMPPMQHVVPQPNNTSVQVPVAKVVQNNNANVAQQTVQQPKVTQPVVEQQKVEQQKVEQPITAQPKAEEPKVEQPVQAKPPVEEPIVEKTIMEEQPPVEEQIVEEQKFEETKAEITEDVAPSEAEPEVIAPIVEEPTVEETKEEIPDIIDDSQSTEEIPSIPDRSVDEKSEDSIPSEEEVCAGEQSPVVDEAISEMITEDNNSEDTQQ